MIALYDKGSGGLAAGWSYLKLLEHWQRKHNRAAYVPYLREGSGDGTTVEFGPLVTLGISTGFGLFLQAFRDGKASTIRVTKPSSGTGDGRRIPGVSSASTSTTSPPSTSK